MLFDINPAIKYIACSLVSLHLQWEIIITIWTDVGVTALLLISQYLVEYEKKLTKVWHFNSFGMLCVANYIEVPNFSVERKLFRYFGAKAFFFPSYTYFGVQGVRLIETRGLLEINQSNFCF